MLKVVRYSFRDLLRSRWVAAYGLFFLAVAAGLFAFGEDPSMAIVSVLNLILIVIPLVSAVLGMTHFYNSREFVELLLAQPIDRTSVFLGHYIGVCLALALAFVLGLLGPFLWYGVQDASQAGTLAALLLAGVLLTLIFVGLAYAVSVRMEDRVKALGMIVFLWLYFAVLYDGLLLIVIALFQVYPLETALIGLTALNPLDLARILILLRLDVSALMGYTGAVFEKFFGSVWGVGLTLLALGFWSAVPALVGVKLFSRKDF